MSLENAVLTLRAARESCSNCRTCTRSCEVTGDGHYFVGQLAFELLEKGGDDISTAESQERFLGSLKELASRRPEIVFTVRRCCMCGFCTVRCPQGIDIRQTMRAARELLSLAGVTSDEGFEVTQVDREWHIFSAYRAVFGIYYQDLPHIAEVKSGECDMLFFPGCSLVSYAPQLTRAAYAWLVGQGWHVALSEDCCGSPLISAGFDERAADLRRRIVDEIVAAGIHKVVTVCPGCMEELESCDGRLADVEFIPLPRLLADAGVTIDSAVAGRAGRVAVSDSCHDRLGRFGGAIREILSTCEREELEFHGTDTKCCGSAGSCVLVDPELCSRRYQRPLLECSDKGIDALVAACPTCDYGWASELRSNPDEIDAPPQPLNYLELVFDEYIDWDEVFGNLESMWSGEYGPWLSQVFFS